MAWPIIEPKRVRAINSCVWDTTLFLSWGMHLHGHEEG